jgi:phage protein D
MITPAYKLTIGGKVVDTTNEPKASTVVDLRVELDMNIPADRATLVLGQVNGLHPSVDDDATVELGYADNGGLTQVMTGKVVTVEPALTRSRIVAYTAAQTLLRSFTDQTYQSKTAGAIVRDLCSQCNVDVATADDGINFPAYVVDGRRSFSRHIQDLAELCGFDAYFNSAGKLVFQQFTTGNQVHVLEYTKDVLELHSKRAPAFATSVVAWGESPTGTDGDNSWPWLTKNFAGTKGTAGSGAPVLLLEHPGLRTHDAAQTAATAAETRFQQRTLEGWVLTIGRPQAQLGDAIQFQSMPDASLNTTFQVRSVVHSITKDGGFTTQIGFRSLAAA